MTQLQSVDGGEINLIAVYDENGKLSGVEQVKSSPPQKVDSEKVDSSLPIDIQETKLISVNLDDKGKFTKKEWDDILLKIEDGEINWEK